MPSTKRKREVPVLYGLEDIADRKKLASAAKHSAAAEDKIVTDELRRAVAARVDLAVGQSVHVATSSGLYVNVAANSKYRKPSADHLDTIDGLAPDVRALAFNDRRAVDVDVDTLRHALRNFPGAFEALLEADGVEVTRAVAFRREAADVAVELDRKGHPDALAMMSLVDIYAFDWQVTPQKPRK